MDCKHCFHEGRMWLNKSLPVYSCCECEEMERDWALYEKPMYFFYSFKDLLKPKEYRGLVGFTHDHAEHRGVPCLCPNKHV